MRNRLLALFMALSLLLSACGGEETAAATMHLVKTEGTVSVDDAKGKSVSLMENLDLFSGYSVATRAASYGWINMDDTRLAKLDENSQTEIRRDGKLLELYVRSGSLFFNVTEPLAEDETMNIRTSTMMVGIRGTCGWVEAEGEDLMRVYLLQGKVQCTVLDENGGVLSAADISAGQCAVMEADGSISIVEFDGQDVPDFVIEAVNNPGDWFPGRDLTPDAEEGAPAPEYEADTSFVPWAEAGVEDHVMEWNDEALEYAMRYFTGIEAGDIMLSDVWEFGHLSFGAVPDFYWYQLTNIEALGELSNLSGINIDGSARLTDLTPLSKLPNLQYLRLVSCGLSDVSALAGLTGLVSLDLSQNPLSDISPLAGLTQLENLYLMRCEISDISPLSGMTELTILYIDRNQITDVSALAGMTKLKLLDLSSNQVGDVSALSGLTQLETLLLSMNPVADVAPVMFVPNLSYDEQTDFPGAGTQPGTQPAQEAAAAAVSLAEYAGTYTPYPAYDYYSHGNSVTMSADGVFTGGETDGRAPGSVSRNADGSILISFGSDERYTIYPVGVPMPEHIQNVNTDEVNIEYLYTGGGAMNIVYHAAPTALGS